MVPCLCLYSPEPLEIELCGTNDCFWTGIDEIPHYDIGEGNVGRYLRHLAEIKFVSWPSGTGRAFPEVNMSAMEMQAVGALAG